MKKYQAILLDLDNTLYAYQPAHQAAFQALMKELERQHGIDSAAAESAYRLAKKKIDFQLMGTAASHHRLLYTQKICELLGLNPIFFALPLYHLYWNTFLEHMVLFPEALTFLSTCRLQNKRITIVTDLTADIQYQKIARLNIQEYIDHIVISEEIGHNKPHPLMFLSALNKLKLSADQVVMIGDHYEKDVYGARALGIDAYLFSPMAEIIQDEKSYNFSTLLQSMTNE